MANQMETNAVAKFVSHKISKLRWKPSVGNVTHKATVFASGSWDDYENSVGVWTVTSDGASIDEDFPQPEGEPRLLCSAPHKGSVMDLAHCNQDLILVASSNGGVRLYKHHTNSETLSVQMEWPSLHRSAGGVGSVCTGVAPRSRTDNVFVSVGEDGRINVVNMDRKAPLNTIERGDSCSINQAVFLKHSEVATVSSSGQLKLWDLRDQSLAQAEPSRTFIPSTSEQIALHCVDKHPTQPHLVATGGEDGTLCLWDMRRDKFPVTMLSAHSSHMWEVHFHPSYPNNLFSCSEDGSAWHWDANKLESMTIRPKSLKDTSSYGDTSFRMTQPTSQTQATSPWLACDAGKNRLKIVDLLAGNTLPVNSVDVWDTTMICATDAEQIISVQNLNIL